MEQECILLRYAVEMHRNLLRDVQEVGVGGEKWPRTHTSPSQNGHGLKAFTRGTPQNPNRLALAARRENGVGVRAESGEPARGSAATTH